MLEQEALIIYLEPVKISVLLYPPKCILHTEGTNEKSCPSTVPPLLPQSLVRSYSLRFVTPAYFTCRWHNLSLATTHNCASMILIALF